TTCSAPTPGPCPTSSAPSWRRIRTTTTRSASTWWPAPASGELTPALALGLALHAAGRLGAGLEPAFRHFPAAVDALPVGAFVQPFKRGEHGAALRGGQVEHRPGTVGVGQVGPRVGGRVLPDRDRAALQHPDRPIEFGEHLFQSLTSGRDVHGSAPPGK